MQGRIIIFSSLLSSVIIIITSIVIFVLGTHLINIAEISFAIPDIVLVQKNNKSIIMDGGPILKDNRFIAEMVATGINFPSSMSFVDRDEILVTEKNTGMVKRILNGNITKEPILTVNVENYWEGGLLGIATDKGKVDDSNPDDNTIDFNDFLKAANKPIEPKKDDKKPEVGTASPQRRSSASIRASSSSGSKGLTR